MKRTHLLAMSIGQTVTVCCNRITRTDAGIWLIDGHYMGLDFALYALGA